MLRRLGFDGDGLMVLKEIILEHIFIIKSMRTSQEHVHSSQDSITNQGNGGLVSLLRRSGSYSVCGHHCRQGGNKDVPEGGCESAEDGGHSRTGKGGGEIVVGTDYQRDPHDLEILLHI